MAESEASNPGLKEQFQHKNRLQEYAQRCAIQLPVYETINEGSPHAPQFRSNVTVDGQAFMTAQRFAHRKEAEQDVAKFALESISKKIKHEGCPLIHGDTTFCKSILHEYVAKMKIETPKYTTSQSVGLLPVFISSVAICGKTYTGGPGKSKKEAEQIAARACIESILGDSSTRTLMTEIIKSKNRLYDAIHKGIDSVSLQAGNVVMGENMRNNLLNVMGKDKEPATERTELGQLSDAASIRSKKVKREYTCEPNSCSIGSGISLRDQPHGGLLTGPVSSGFETVTGEPQLGSQLENVFASGVLVMLPCQHECIASSSGNKRRHNNELESPIKRMRNDEESHCVPGT